MVRRAETKELTVIFLVDKNPPDKVVLLKRAPDKSFAPNWYTGIGGKVGDLSEFYGETVLEGVYRELSEETEGELNRKNIKLTEFARCIYDRGLRLHYFWGEYTGDRLPRIRSTDGTLYWVGTGELLSRGLIPTTQAVCEEWSKHDFRIDEPFTVFVHETGRDHGVGLVEVQMVTEGLEF